ncbi:MAG: hypothetical protein MSG64_18745 [Pyrinomonadaceae bacterium MAG19_C2-C3]|nr:hypothetical protein [Pyrinomonadaceae bacterium MAG19_C2-C3]
MKQHEAVIKTIKRLGGVATLGQLNQEVMKIEDCQWKTKTPFASIRRIVQLHPEIYKIKPGLYGLVESRKQNDAKGILVETNENKDNPELIVSNHYYYQGLLLTLGNLKRFKTFSPQQDKNRKFLDKPLSEVRSLTALPDFSYSSLVKRSATIDVIWFNQRGMPNSFFEVESSTDIQNSLGKYNDLQDFYVRMFIVADKRRKAEYEMKLARSSFDEIKGRVVFVDYDSLVKQYENAIAFENIEVVI